MTGHICAYCARFPDTMVRTATTLFLHLFAAGVGSETVEVKDRGTVDLAAFECRDINRSSLIQRACYDKARSYMIISVKGVYSQYCELPAGMFGNLMGAPSMGQFFNHNIRGSGSGGPYDGLNRRLPAY
jgi:KTSC domain-containing protein